MKKTRAPGFAGRLIIITVVLLLTVNVVLGTILVNNSKNAIKSLMQSRMLDISCSAADMLDGDVLKSLKKEDQGTAKYQKIIDTLAPFRDNIDLKYIYCISETDDGEFVFSVDPTIEDPGEFGSPVVFTSALYEASKGKPSVDFEPYTDAWGRFYSAYSPVFDSNGEVAGIVAVDFSADWFDNQINNQTWSILICSALTVIVGVLTVVLATARMRREMKSITRDLADVAADVDELNRNINPNAVSNYKKHGLSNDIHAIALNIHEARESLREYTENLHSQANNMIAAISSAYRAVYYVDLDHDEGICYQPHTEIKNGARQGEVFRYSEIIRRYAENFVIEKYRESFISICDIQSIREELKKERIITYRYVVDRNGQRSYEMIRIAEVHDSEDIDDDTVHAIAVGFSDVDAETRRTLSQSQALSDALASAKVANKAKTAFLSNMSHEIRTPMNAIIGLDKIALSDDSISDSTRDYLEKIGSSADHLLRIINDILDMSRIEAGKMTLHNEVFSLHNVLSQIDVMIGGQCQSKGLQWSCELIGSSSEYYFGDEMKLKQVLINILGNSVKFTESGGKVSLTVERTAQYDGKSVFRFVVSDNGIGISEEFLPKLFEPFRQEDTLSRSKYGSTGLGMPITKSIVEMMNGEIDVESQKGVGTTFIVTLTFNDSEQQDNDESNDSMPQEMSVLIVDDDAVDAEFARLELEKVGISAQTALSGAEAVRMVELKHARRESYNLILIDWKMPGMDGAETARQIRSIIGGDSAIVMLTAYQLDDVLEDGKEAGIDDIIAKPLQANDILSQFKQSLDLKTKKKSGKVSLEGKRILLAEDVDINAEIILMLLKMRGMVGERAVNGAEALEMVKKHPNGYYDAVLMDMRMPVMDGLEATRAIRAMNRAEAKTIPIIALTANAFDEDVRRSLQAGLNAHLSKPVEPDSLYQTLESLIRS